MSIPTIIWWLCTAYQRTRCQQGDRIDAAGVEDNVRRPSHEVRSGAGRTITVQTDRLRVKDRIVENVCDGHCHQESPIISLRPYGVGPLIRRLESVVESGCAGNDLRRGSVATVCIHGRVVPVSTSRHFGTVEMDQ